jgi:hypothetical protein
MIAIGNKLRKLLKVWKSGTFDYLKDYLDWGA